MSLSIEITSPSFIDIEKGKDSIAPKKKEKKQKKVVMSLDQFQKWDGGSLHTVTKPLTSPSVLEALDPVIVAAQRPDPTSFYAKYNGKISNKTLKPQYVRINDVTSKLLFSQTNVSDFNKVGGSEYPLDFLADAMFIEFKRDLNKSGDGALDVVDMGGGYFTSVDNRRLLIAKKIGVIDRTYGIWVRVHKYDESLSLGLQKRFEGAKTWGAAVTGRINDSRYIGYSTLPTIMTVNKFDRREPAKSQTIPLSVDFDLSALHSKDVENIKKIQKNNTVNI